MKVIFATNEYTGANYVLRKVYTQKAVIEEFETLKEELIKYRCVAPNSQIIVRIDDHIKHLKGE